MTQTERQDIAQELFDSFPGFFTVLDDTDPAGPKIGLRAWPAAWLFLAREQDGSIQLRVDGSRGPSALASGELQPVFECFARIRERSSGPT